MHRTTLYLPEEVDLGFTRLARKEGRPKAELVREALWRYLQEKTQGQVPTWVGLGAKYPTAAFAAVGAPQKPSPSPGSGSPCCEPKCGHLARIPAT